MFFSSLANNLLNTGCQNKLKAGMPIFCKGCLTDPFHFFGFPGIIKGRHLTYHIGCSLQLQSEGVSKQLDERRLAIRTALLYDAYIHFHRIGPPALAALSMCSSAADRVTSEDDWLIYQDLALSVLRPSRRFKKSSIRQIVTFFCHYLFYETPHSIGSFRIYIYIYIFHLRWYKPFSSGTEPFSIL